MCQGVLAPPTHSVQMVRLPQATERVSSDAIRCFVGELETVTFSVLNTSHPRHEVRSANPLNLSI